MPKLTDAAPHLRKGGYREAPPHASGIVMNLEQSQIDTVFSTASTPDPSCLRKLELTAINAHERIAAIGVDVKPLALLESGTRLPIGLKCSRELTSQYGIPTFC